MDDLFLYEEIVRLKKERQPAVLATVIETVGSSPRKAGAKMLVYSDGAISGTVGGGAIEADTIAAALDAMRLNAPRILTFNQANAPGSVCGGTMMVYLEPLAEAPRCLIIGNGHVARALAETAGRAGFPATLVGQEDDRAQCWPRVDTETFVFICTSEHQRDFLAAQEALATPARYIAVLGSVRKRKAMGEFLAGQGVAPRQIERIVSPAGIDIGAETPEEIAVSVVAQMIQLRRLGAVLQSVAAPTIMVASNP